MHKRKGFTITELAVAISVIAILATLGGLAWRSSRDNAENKVRQAEIIEVRDAVERYYQDKNQYPFPSGCFKNMSTYVECHGNELEALLVPEYLDEYPDDPIPYAASRIPSSNEDDPEFRNRYAFRFLLEETRDGEKTYCKTGKNMRESWWGGAPPCNF